MFWIILSVTLPIAGAKVHHALLIGLFLAILLGLFPEKFKFLPEVGPRQKNFSKYILQFGVALLGACLPLSQLMSLGLFGLGVTFVSIFLILILGNWLGKFLGLDKQLSLLISFGTAICGGSAIAAMSSTIKARNQDVAISMILVFMLNALALFLFPPIGHYLGLNDMQFGKWVALSIHDTSSVVAASSLWSKDALTTATTLKLVRALWIVPFTFYFATRNKNGDSKIKIPFFILAFIAMSIMVSVFPTLTLWESRFSLVAKWSMASSLFLIGLGLKISQLRDLDGKTVFHAVGLWITVSIVSLTMIMNSWY